jgi:hypothetical protein
MRQTVTVNGVELTRAQVEGAMKALEAPEPEGWRGGDRLTMPYMGMEFVVLGTQETRDLRELVYPGTVGSRDVVVVSLKTGAIYNWSPEWLATRVTRVTG